MDRRWFLEIMFDGTPYHGWQLQENAHTVQHELEKALFTALRKPITVVGCGRTDTGVHAKQFFVHFDYYLQLDSYYLLHKLNNLLPKTIAVVALFEVKSDAHARFDATDRTYEYLIHQQKNPFLLSKSYYIPTVTIDVDTMNKAAETLINYKDFKAFSKSRTQVKNYECTLHQAEWSKTPEGIKFTITANRFLRNMVRAVVGTLLEIGTGKQPISYLNDVLISKNRSVAGVSVPACGLYLTQIKYPNNVYI